MAVMLIGGVKYTNVPVWLKGRLLTDTIETTEDIAVLSVESGSERGKRYNCRHDGTHALSCDCQAKPGKPCCHMIAVDRYLELASDEQAHIDDSELAAIADEIEDELAQQAWAILAAEKAAQERARKMAANQAYRDMYPGDYGYCDVA